MKVHRGGGREREVDCVCEHRLCTLLRSVVKVAGNIHRAGAKFVELQPSQSASVVCRVVSNRRLGLVDRRGWPQI